MTRYGLLGDTHGNANTVLAALRRFQKEDITQILQVGDFGVWPGNHGSTFLSYVNKVLAKNGQTLYVTPGNHEDYDQINSWYIHDDGWARAREHILVAPRGLRWTWEGVSFVSLGGAPSVDRKWRVENEKRGARKSWWAEEDITDADIVKVTSGGHADVMVAHDAPYGVPSIERRIAGNPNGFHPDDLKYSDQGRQKMYNVVDIVRPKVFLHGHYHFVVDDKLEIFNENTGLPDTVRIIGMNADGAYGTCGVLTLPELQVDFWG